MSGTFQRTILGEIPVLGTVVRNRSNEDQNLMILVTPTIVQPNP